MAEVESSSGCEDNSPELEIEFQIPNGITITANNFTPYDLTEDDIPLMPCYNTYEKRLATFKDMPDPCQEEIEALAKMGFYFFGVEKWGPPGVSIEVGKKTICPFSVLCFCCGSQTFVQSKIVIMTELPPLHHLNCKFLNILPKEEQELIKMTNQPNLARLENIDFTYMNECRAKVFPDRKYDKPIGPEVLRKAGICPNCNERKQAVWLCPCFHSLYCIQCAKATNQCYKCNQVIKGIMRKFIYY